MTEPTPLALGWYLGFVRRYLFLIADCALLGTIITVGVLLISPHSYRGTADVVLTVPPLIVGDVDPSERPMSIDTDAQLAGSAAVLQAAAERTGFPGGAEALGESLQLTARPNAYALRVRVSSDDRAKAMAAAEAICEELLTVREKALATRLESQRVLLGQQAELISAQLATPLFISDREQLEDQLADLQVSLAELEAQTPYPGFVTGPASGSRGGRPGLQVTLASGTMLGALVGIGLAALIESVRSARREERRRRALPVRFRTGWAAPNGTGPG